MSRALTSERIVELARARGFALAGVSPLSVSERAAEFRAWLAAGRHGTMAYLAENESIRFEPARLLDGALSVIMVADQYADRQHARDGALEPGRGRIARYARGRDYHKVIKKRLHDLCDELRAHEPGAAFRAFTDTAPVFERELALKAGLGWIGKHTLLIHPERGSYLLLGGIVTTLELEPPTGQRVEPDHCGSCTRCIDACPTGCISAYSVDASRCISYLTIERRRAIPAERHAGIGEWVFGCDVCQEVCPHNSPRGAAWAESHASGINDAYETKRDSFDLLEVLGWTEDDRREAFTSSAMKRATLAMMKRNALVVLGNQLRGGMFHEEQVRALRARLGEIAGDALEDEMVRETAGVVLGEIGGG